MGNSVSNAVREMEAAQNRAEDQVKMDVQNLATILDAKQNEYYERLINSKGEDKTIPIKTLVEYKKHASVNVSTEPSQQLTSAIEELFGGNFLSSLKALTLGAINTVLGHATSGQKEDSGYKILLINSVVVRVDYYVYGYNMYSTGVVDRRRSGLVFVATIGTVDLKAVGLEVLVYLVGKQATDAQIFLKKRAETWKQRQSQLQSQGTEATPDTDSGRIEVGKVDKATLIGWNQILADELLDDEKTNPAKPEDDWGKLREAVLVKMTKAIDAQDDLLKALPREQERILDEMQRIFTRARQVSGAVTGLTA